MNDGVETSDTLELLATKRQRVLEALTELTGNTNAQNAFVTISLQVLLKWSSYIIEEESRGLQPALIDYAAYYLYPLFGNTAVRDAAAIEKIADQLASLLGLENVQASLREDNAHTPELREIAAHVESYVRNVRGTQYISQSREQIYSLLGPFENWFNSRVGIGPKRATEILIAVHSSINGRLSEALTKSEGEAPDASSERASPSQTGIPNAPLTIITISSGLADVVAVRREEVLVGQSTPSEQEWNALVNLLGFTPAFRQGIKSPVECKRRPLFVMPDGSVFLPNLSSSFEEILSAFHGIAKNNIGFFNGKYQRSQKSWVENKVWECMRRIFPESSLYRSLDYPDPDAKQSATAELDLAVLWGPFLVLIEVKGRQFRLPEGRFDLGRLRSDLKANIADAYQQSRRAIRFINLNPNPVFIERGTERKLVIAKDRLRRVLQVCVSLHHLADFATQLACLKPLRLFEPGEYPFSVSVGDLDIITRFCDSPEVLLHFIARRIELQMSERSIVGDELDLFGAYLDTRLDPSAFWNRTTDDGKAFTMMWIHGGAEQFDNWHDHVIGVRAEAPNIGLSLPSEVKELLADLRVLEGSEGKWLAFLVLGLSMQGCQRLAALLRLMQESDMIPGKASSTLFVDGEHCVVITAGRFIGEEELQGKLRQRLKAEKYRRRLLSAFGFGFDFNDPIRRLKCTATVEGPWCKNASLERLLLSMGPLAVRPGQPMPERGDPCPCGSGKVFEECCAAFF